MKLERFRQRLSRGVVGGANFVTIRQRPKRDPARDPAWAPDLRDDTAIVLQGPLVDKDDFTTETVRRYRRNFPNTPIIVSTWQNEKRETIASLKAEGAHIIVQSPPELDGVQNSNRQMLSAASGVSAAVDLGMTFVLKTRTDQRLYSERLLGLLHSTIKTFPLDGSRGLQTERLVGLSSNTFAYRMYGLSDMVIFGAIEDMSLYWDGTLDYRNLQEPISASTLRQFAELNVCEVRYCSEFLKRTGWIPRWTLRDSWEAMASRFAILDSSAVDLYWPKYTDVEERWRSYSGDPRFLEIDFAMWMMLRTRQLVPDEAHLDLQLGSL